MSSPAALKRLAMCCAALASFVALSGFGEFPPMFAFPPYQQRNDALCQSYGYRPGTRIYARCRREKDAVSRQARAAAVPDVTPIPLLLFFDHH